MADPVTIPTPDGPMTLARASALWIYEKLGSDDELVETRNALDQSLRGFPVTLPDKERDDFCERLGAVLASLSPAELSSLEPQEADRLRSAVCG